MAPIKLRLATVLVLGAVLFVGFVGTSTTRAQAPTGAEASNELKPRRIDDAVAMALDWICEQQGADGSGTSRAREATATALAVRALAAQRASTGANPKRDEAAKRGLAYLMQRQERYGWIGDFASGLGAYEHASATLALLAHLPNGEEAAAAPQDLRKTTQLALDALATRRNEDGAWGYSRWASHTSVVALVATALDRGRRAGLNVDASAVDAVTAWLRSARRKGPAGYDACKQPGMAATALPAASQLAVDASGLLAERLLATALDPNEHEDTLLRQLSDAAHVDLDAAYMASFAFAFGTERGDAWHRKHAARLLEVQSRAGFHIGSWNPELLQGAHGEKERVRATALAVLTLMALQERPIIEQVEILSGEQLVDEEVVDEPVVDEPVSDIATIEPAAESNAPVAADRVLPRASTRSGEVQATRAAAIANGLAWLARHQSEDGSFGAKDFVQQCPEDDRCSGSGNELTSIGPTGLALLAFLGEGSTLRGGTHAKVVRRAAQWLVEQQDDKGVIGTVSTRFCHYNHAIATYALAEAYGQSKYDALKGHVQAAVDYIHSARNPYKVWRYWARGGDNDTSVTIWMLLALSAAKDFGLRVDKDAFKYVDAWLHEVTNPPTGQVGYSKRGEPSSRNDGMAQAFPPNRTEALTAAGLYGRVLLGRTPQADPIMNVAADTILELPPTTDKEKGSVDYCYWFFATRAMHQMGRHHWTQWKKALAPTLLESQVKSGHAAGSWDPVSAWSADGGRVYTTALAVLCLETYYRSTPLLR